MAVEDRYAVEDMLTHVEDHLRWLRTCRAIRSVGELLYRMAKIHFRNATYELRMMNYELTANIQL
jgi:hypothetical protein